MLSLGLHWTALDCFVVAHQQPQRISTSLNSLSIIRRHISAASQSDSHSSELGVAVYVPARASADASSELAS